MLYSYIALNTENQKLKGVINASDERGAKNKLHNVGLSVLSLQEANDADDAETISTSSKNNKNNKNKDLHSFYFFVIDPKGKKLSGSIESTNRKHAFRRLVEEYGFEVLSICDASTPEALRYKEGKKGLKEIEKEIEYEFGIITSHFREGGKNLKKEEDFHDKDFEAERKEILKEIEMVSKKTQEILRTYHQSIDAQAYSEIEKLLRELIRLRFSNNFSLIRKLIESLFEKIGESMKKNKHTSIVDKRDYDQILEEERLLEQMKKSSGVGSKNIILKLKNFSSSLDVFLGSKKDIQQKGLFRKNNGIFKEVFENFTFLRRLIKAFFIASFTGNKALKAERFDSLKKKIEAWNKKKKEIKRHKALEKQKEKFKEKRKNLSKGSIFFLLLDELRVFTGTVLLVILFFTFISIFIITNNIDFQRMIIAKSLYSPLLRSFTIGVFIAFFSLVMQNIFFRANIIHSLLFFTIMTTISSFYFINL